MKNVIDYSLTPRGAIPQTPRFPPLPEKMAGNPFGLDANGVHIKDIRGNVIKPVITIMLADVERRALKNGLNPKIERDRSLDELTSRLNERIPSPLHRVTGAYLMNDGNLYSYEFSAFLHHICADISQEPGYFFNIGRNIIPDSMSFFFRAAGVLNVYTTIARIGSKFSSERFETLEHNPRSIVIQRRTPVTRDQLGETLWAVHISSGCQTLRGALSTIPHVHSKLPDAEIEERKCLLLGDDCCEWKFIWQEPKKRGWFGWA